jgi:SAM-dependent methyltransferase
VSYTTFDRFVARQRFRAVLPFISPGASVCDLGCGIEAAFLTFAAAKISRGVGLDDQVSSDGMRPWPVIRADIRKPLPLIDGQFDHVVMLAVLEHLREPLPVLSEAFRILRPTGSLLLTWPRAVVDPFLHMLHGLGAISAEMESNEHQRRIPIDRLVEMLRGIGFARFIHGRFELGLNNLLVAEKKEEPDRTANLELSVTFSGR